MGETRDRDLVAVVNEVDEPVGALPKGELGTRRGLHFRTAHIFLIDEHGNLLLQQLAPNRDRSPGKWGSSVAAYVRAGETYEEAASRRANEELGITTRLHSVGLTQMPDLGGTKHIALFSGRIPTWQLLGVREPDHIATINWFSFDEIWERLSLDWMAFTETFVWLFARFFSDGERRRSALSA